MKRISGKTFHGTKGIFKFLLHKSITVRITFYSFSERCIRFTPDGIFHPLLLHIADRNDAVSGKDNGNNGPF